MATWDDLSKIEKEAFEEARRTGDLNCLSELYLRPQASGTRWGPDEALGSYRDLLTWDMLLATWEGLGRPSEFVVDIDGVEVTIVRDPVREEFLMRHGYIFLPWARPFVALDTTVGMVISGAGTAKTSSTAIAAALYCVMYPGFQFMNAGPSDKQARLVVKELDYWMGGTAFLKFVGMRMQGRKTHVDRPNVIYTFLSPYASSPMHVSRIMCQTIGVDATSLTGMDLDWLNVDEAQSVIGLEDAMGPVMTRMRGYRPDGSQRSVKLTLISNPGSNVQLEQLKKRVIGLRDAGDPEVKALLIEDLSTNINPYISRIQKKRQMSMLDQLDRMRWLGGDQSSIEASRDIPEVIIERCRDEELTQQLEKGDFGASKREGVGVIHYAMPRVEGHSYLVAGDPGQSDYTRLRTQNKPVLTVWDVTGFPQVATTLCAIDLLDGGGSYRPWLTRFIELMNLYSCMGFYDATNVRTAWEDFDTFTLLPTQPIFFDYSSKPWARTIFVTLAQNGLFRWPYLMSLWYEASVYRTTGVGINKIADDFIASAFVFCLALRTYGTIWTQLTSMFHKEFKLKEEEIKDEHSLKTSVGMRRYTRPQGVRR